MAGGFRAARRLRVRQGPRVRCGLVVRTAYRFGCGLRAWPGGLGLLPGIYRFLQRGGFFPHDLLGVGHLLFRGVDPLAGYGCSGSAFFEFFLVLCALLCLVREGLGVRVRHGLAMRPVRTRLVPAGAATFTGPLRRRVRRLADRPHSVGFATERVSLGRRVPGAIALLASGYRRPIRRITALRVVGHRPPTGGATALGGEPAPAAMPTTLGGSPALAAAMPARVGAGRWAVFEVLEGDDFPGGPFWRLTHHVGRLGSVFRSTYDTRVGIPCGIQLGLRRGALLYRAAKVGAGAFHRFAGLLDGGPGAFLTAIDS
ncbi:hypothetical protein, partial [Streptomyces tsukubensis]